MEILVESQGSPSGNRVVEINPSRGGNVCLAQLTNGTFGAHELIVALLAVERVGDL